MIKGKYDELEPLIGRNVCGECGAAIELAWDSDIKSYYVSCGKGHRPDSLRKIPSLTTEHRTQAQTSAPGPGTRGPKTSQTSPAKYQTPQAIVLGGFKAVDLGTGELLPFEVVKNLVTFAERYNLDLVRGHVVIMYSKPYITLDGYLYHANQSGIPFQLRSRPCTSEERTELQVVEGDHAWRAELIKPGTDDYTLGIGIVTKVEMEEESTKSPGQLRSPVVARHPWQLAQKRAEWQSMRRGFPIGESPGGINEAGD